MGEEEKKRANNSKIVRQSNLKDFSLRGYTSEHQLFSDKSQNLPGGGRFTLTVANEKIAMKILAHYRKDIAFFQVARNFTVKRSKGNNARVTGFSPKISPSQISGVSIKRGIRDASVNAANQLGHHFDYDREKSPTIVKPTTKNSFMLVIWFRGDSRNRFFPSEE